ncbi:hypothetical protein XA26_50610 [Mycolicibacterium fortuitum]|uniref:Uncharacterized protein n=1 Tax=Mycolicibacterium fortuitum TaxID=1766 RepID=A0A0N9YGT9_MYCFO|nr:hypothetical protein XA26_50610 [Mycolicibacterium fortuitum]
MPEWGRIHRSTPPDRPIRRRHVDRSYITFAACVGLDHIGRAKIVARGDA